MKTESRIRSSVKFFQIFERCLDPGSYDCRPNTKVQCLNSHMEYVFNLETGPTSNDGNEDTHFYSPSQWRTSGCIWVSPNVSDFNCCHVPCLVWKMYNLLLSHFCSEHTGTIMPNTSPVMWLKSLMHDLSWIIPCIFLEQTRYICNSQEHSKPHWFSKQTLQ